MKLDSFKIVPRGILIKRVLKKARVATVSKARKDGWWWKNKSKRSNKTSVCSYQVSVVDSWRERESELARIVLLLLLLFAKLFSSVASHGCLRAVTESRDS